MAMRGIARWLETQRVQVPTNQLGVFKCIRIFRIWGLGFGSRYPVIGYLEVL